MVLLAAKRLMEYTRVKRPDLYKAILFRIQPHSLDSVLRIIEDHLRNVSDLNIFNENMEAIPEFVYSIITRFKYPVPGDGIGIKKACRVTKSETQVALDSKHLQSSSGFKSQFNVEKYILHDLALFSTQKHVFEFSNRRRYSTVYMACSIEELLKLLPDSCHLIRNSPRNKGKNLNGEFKYLTDFKYILVEDRGSIKVLYKSLKDLFNLMKRISPKKIVAFSDVRGLFQKCGIVSHFYNMVKVVEKQMFINDGSAYEKDILTFIKYQCQSGKPLALTRDGLAKNPERTPLEVVSFEAPKRNFARISTGATREEWYDVTTSTDKMFGGQQFNEGTGYQFQILPKKNVIYE